MDTRVFPKGKVSKACEVNRELGAGFKLSQWETPHVWDEWIRLLSLSSCVQPVKPWPYPSLNGLITLWTRRESRQCGYFEIDMETRLIEEFAHHVVRGECSYSAYMGSSVEESVVM
ncbi:hypothetical protein F2Q68_00039513 [Brassica cretica]|uniref:Uncharacterized protein n=2 Tax=Brassica cretica TaxID=69181 RepID=A0A8S9MKE6_BRACR|nr:hypothetical protein F2Q68_00039513 [Brassica cretica]KAF3496153.1 hypothetical protein DY000_02053095 [Brassica cretica]